MPPTPSRSPLFRACEIEAAITPKTPIRRLAIVGNTGTGKTTLGNRLAPILNLPVTHLDLMYWQPGWKRTEPDDFDSAHHNAIHDAEWIIDGNGVLTTIPWRLERADTVIFTDYPLWRNYWWALKRQVKFAIRPRPDLPQNCPMLPITFRVLGLIWEFQRGIRFQLLHALAQLGPEKRIIHLRRPSDLRRLISHLTQNAKNAALPADAAAVGPIPGKA